MSSSSSYGSLSDSEEDTTSWLMSSEDSVGDEDELTLLNGDEENDEDSTNFEAFIRLSMRLKKQYNLREASVALERCDKIWDTMQLLKSAQTSYKAEEEEEEAEEDEEEEDEDETDDENDGSDPPKSSIRTSDSVSTGAIPYIKYQPTQGNGNNALPNFYLSVKKQTKIYNCGTCGKIYNEKRAFRIHMKRDHGIALPGPPQIRKRLNNSETRPSRPKTPQSTDTSSVDGDKASRARLSKRRNQGEALHPCPICGNLYSYKGSLRKHAKELHGVEIPVDDKKSSKNDGETKKSEPSTTSSKITSVKNEDKRAKKTDQSGINYVYTHTRINNLKHYIYFCIICQKQCSEKRSLRNHMRAMHQIDIPKGPEGTLCGLFIKDVETSREYLRRLNRDKKFDESPPKLQTQRAGPRSSKTSERPKRACAENTSYTELTKEEEELVQLEKVSSEASGRSLSTEDTTQCFLCKKSCVDMIRHLKDYHRISKPDSILPLNEQLSNDQISERKNDKVKIEVLEREEEKNTSSQTKIPSEQKFRMKKRSRKELEISELDTNRIKGLFRQIKMSGKYGKRLQCLMCGLKYSKLSGLKKHFASKIKDGVIQDHQSSHGNRLRMRKLSQKRIYYKKKGTAQDPLKLDDALSVDSESSSMNRGSSCSDESSSTNEAVPCKRRKIEFAKASKGIDKASDTGNDESEEEKAMRKWKKNFRYNQQFDTMEGDEDGEEDKSLGQRDTRDSSDRDSGIGISITIKKRNNSYEVVERDNYCVGDKAKEKEDFEASKDDNLMSSDSSSNITNSDDRNGDELDVKSRIRKIFNPLDSSEERNVNKSTTISTQNQDDDDITIVECTNSTFPRSSKQMSRQQNVRSSFKASTKNSGKVPSLKVLCRNLLKRHRVSCFTENYVNSHQCPVCCRFYPTERDVTLHMIEHKVSRTTFRCTGMLGIPKTALRRYGRRKTFQ